MTLRPILFAGRDPSPHERDSGHASYVRAHGLAARRAGLDPIVIALAREPGPPVAEHAFGTIHREPRPARMDRQMWIAAISRRLEHVALQAIPAREPVLLHGFGVWSYPARRVQARLRARGRSAPLITSSYTTMRDEAISHWRGRSSMSPAERAKVAFEIAWAHSALAPFERAAYTGADVIAVNYEAVAALVRQRFGAGLPVRRLVYAAEPAFDAPSPTPPAPDVVARLQPSDAPLVLCASSHQGRKGVDVLIAALGQLRAAGVPFRAVLAGRPMRLIDRHRAMAAELDLDGSVAIPGFVADLAPLLAHADVFVLPSIGEQSGSVAVLEALGAGLPVVSTAVDGMLEDLTDEVDALMVAPGNATALAAALRRLLTDAELRASLGAAGLQTSARRFSAEVFTAQLGALYAEVGGRADP